MKPSIVFNQIKMKTPSLVSNNGKIKKKTPGFVRAVRHQIKTIQKTQKKLNNDIALFTQTYKKLVINNDVLQHENGKLQKTLQNEKKH